MTILFEPLFTDVSIPERATQHSTGLDLRAYLRGRVVRLYSGHAITERPTDDTITIAPGERALIPLGFKAAVPVGLDGQVRIRSSLAFNKGLIIPNAPATIDPDYHDEWVVLVANIGTSAIRIEHGERFAQVVFCSVQHPTWRIGAVNATTDRTGGLGSTGSR